MFYKTQLVYMFLITFDILRNILMVAGYTARYFPVGFPPTVERCRHATKGRPRPRTPSRTSQRRRRSLDASLPRK